MPRWADVKVRLLLRLRSHLLCPSVVEQCICNRIQADEMVLEWVAYSTTKNGLKLTMDALEQFEHEVTGTCSYFKEIKTCLFSSWLFELGWFCIRSVFIFFAGVKQEEQIQTKLQKRRNSQQNQRHPLAAGPVSFTVNPPAASLCECLSRVCDAVVLQSLTSVVQNQGRGRGGEFTGLLLNSC